MKKIVSLLLAISLLSCLCGCKEPSGDAQTETATTTTSPTEETTAILPDVVYSIGDDAVYKDVLALKDGGFVTVGYKDTYNQILSLLRLCDNNGLIKKEYLFDDGNGFEKVASCFDGGFIAASYNPPCLTKISRDFHLEWVVDYYNPTYEGQVFDLMQIGVEYAVLFAATPYAADLKLAFLDEAGELTKTIDLAEDIGVTDADIIPDVWNGFYLVLTCDQTLASKFDLVKDNGYRNEDTDVILMHFNQEKQLTFTQTFGGNGDDWVEESTVDADGNFYIAVGTNTENNDLFGEMNVDALYPYRRMLIKLDKNGNLVYKLPLSSGGMAVDQVFGIHVKDRKAYVVGMAHYFDGYQSKYPCEQISNDESEDRVFSVYTLCVDETGKELNRRIFRCDINDTPCDSTLLSGGELVIAGQISGDDDPFRLDLPSYFDRAPAFYIYDSLTEKG